MATDPASKPIPPEPKDGDVKADVKPATAQQASEGTQPQTQATQGVAAESHPPGNQSGDLSDHTTAIAIAADEFPADVPGLKWTEEDTRRGHVITVTKGDDIHTITREAVLPSSATPVEIAAAKARLQKTFIEA